MSRSFVEKLASGEYIHKWNGFFPILIGGSYSQSLFIGEEKYQKCIGEFCGIGDVDWWVVAELEKLTEEETAELIWICKYKSYVREFISFNLVDKLATFFNCKHFHINRTGQYDILQLLLQLNQFDQLIDQSSKNSTDSDTEQYRFHPKDFSILTFKEFKIVDSIKTQDEIQKAAIEKIKDLCQAGIYTPDEIRDVELRGAEYIKEWINAEILKGVIQL